MNTSQHTQRKRILFVHYGENWIRGSEVCLLTLIQHIDLQQFSPVVWCNTQALANEVSTLGIPVEVDNFSILGGWSAPKFDVFNYFRLIKKGHALVKKYDIDLIHCNSGAPHQWMLPVARLCSLPSVLHLHSPYLLRDRISQAHMFSPCIVGVSEAVVAALKNDGVPTTAINVIYNGVNTDVIAATHSNTARTKPTHHDQQAMGQFSIATLGSLIQRKGIDIVLHSTAQLIERKINVKLTVIGDGPERNNLVQLATDLGISDHVTFTGEIHNAQHTLAHNVDVLVSGAREEAFGLTLIEAGIMGIPTIAPSVGGIPEVIAHEKTGLLIPPENPTAMANAMVTLYKDRTWRQQLGNNAQEHVAQKFSQAHYIAAFEALYLKQLATQNTSLLSGKWAKDMLRLTFRLAKQLTHAVLNRCGISSLLSRAPS